jgi:2-dehydropantoate 2-reductase
VISFPKIAVIGTGALGGYYGARLARAGNSVSFQVRSDLEEVRARGLSLQMPQESFTLHPVAAFADTAEIGPCDLVIIALKATGNHALGGLVRPLLHEKTTLLTLENGLGSDELLAAQFGSERVVGGLCFICVNRVAPGEILCIEPGSVAFAEFGRPATDRVRAIAKLFSDAGVKSTVSDKLDEVRWKKLVWNIPFNGLSIAAGGITTDRILADPLLEGQVRALMLEVIEAAARLGHAIPVEFMIKQIENTRPMGAYKPSSLIDYLAGREVEVEAIWGEPLRRALAVGAKMPRLEALYATLKKVTKS